MKKERRVGSSTEALGGADLGFGGFVFAVAGGGGGFERPQKAHGSGGDLVDYGVEGFFVGLGRLVETGDFPDKLERSGAHFFGSNGRVDVKERFDVSAHS